METCSICLYPMTTEMISVDYDGNFRLCSLDCGHKYHAICIYHHLRFRQSIYPQEKRCPLCRENIINVTITSQYSANAFVLAKRNNKKRVYATANANEINVISNNNIGKGLFLKMMSIIIMLSIMVFCIIYS